MERARTYGIGGFIGVFVGLSVLGLAMLFLVGTSRGATEVMPVAQTLPDGYARPAEADEHDAASTDAEDGEAATDTPDATTTTMAPAVTTPPGPSSFPDGSPAPEGVTEVLVDGGSTTLTFALPEGFAVDTATPAVPPTTVTIIDDGNALEVRTACAVSADEVLAQVNVTEIDDSVTVLAVVLVPEGGAPCGSNVGRVVGVPLQSPLDGRSLNVVPRRTATPEIGSVG